MAVAGFLTACGSGEEENTNTDTMSTTPSTMDTSMGGTMDTTATMSDTSHVGHDTTSMNKKN